MKSRPALWPAALVACLLSASPVSAQEWTRFRGPNGAGQSEAAGIPIEFGSGDYLFETPLPGIGHGSPVVWGERLFLLSGDPTTAERHVLCLSATSGEILWTQSYASTPHRTHHSNSYAPGTPCVDAEAVYAAWATPEGTTLLAHSHTGEHLWEIDLGPFISMFGFGTSPMLYGDFVILALQQQGEVRNNPTPGESFIVAIDRKSGEIRWRSDRPSKIAAYGVPCVLEQPGRPDQLICTSTAEGIFSLDPLTGESNWSLPVFEQRSVASPIVVGDMIFANNGMGSGGNYVVALRAGDPPTEAYRITSQAPYVPSLIARDNLVFLWSDRGIATCIEATDGSVHWSERIGGKFMGSPVRVDDRLYVIDEAGEVVVLRAAEEYELLARNPLDEPSRSTPCVSGGRMYLRTESHLFCVGGDQ